MRTRISLSLVVAALLGTAAGTARAQQPTVDARWLAYLGCWEPIESVKSPVCIVPTAGTSAVELLTIAKGQVVTRERIATAGERVETARGECSVVQTAEWSARGHRVYLRSTETCGGGSPRSEGTGLIAMAGDGQWLYVQGMTLNGQTGVSVQRYHEIAADSLLPDEVQRALLRDVTTTRRARAAARIPLSDDDVIEATKHLDTPVVEAWLVERGEPFTLDADRLVALADAGVPSQVIDLMVALSYPKVFAINPASRQGERLSTAPSVARGSYGRTGGYFPFDPLCSSISLLSYYYAPYDCLGYGRRFGFGSGYGYGWYPGGHPVTIVFVGSGGGSRPHGRVINGQGYRRGSDAAAQPVAGDPGFSTRTKGSSSGSGSGSGSSPSSSSGSGERTAKPRPPR